MSSAFANSLDEGEHHPLVGETLRGTYRIRRVLDRGGMGTVFEAEHTRIRRRVAIKVLARHLMGEQQALARFNREAEIVSQLEHPNVVQIVDFDTTESGEPYLVMEYLTGCSLATLLAERGVVELRQAALLAHQIAAGLSAAHRAAVVHRDLKPANVFLVDLADGSTWVKLLDFGISKRLGQRRLTGEHDALGTPEYVAPEQAQRGLSIDPRSDQYSLAVIIYEALSGRTPFGGPEQFDARGPRASGAPIPLRRWVASLPDAVEAVLETGMERDPDDRYPTVLDFASELLAAAGCASSPQLEPLQLAPLPRHTGATPALSQSAVARGPTLDAFPGADAPVSEETIAPARPSAPMHAEPGELLDRAREAFGLGDLDLAVSYVESALALAERLRLEDDPRLERSAVLIDNVLLARLRGHSAPLRLRSAPDGHTLLPEQAFLVSRLEDRTTVDEVLDLSPLSRRATLRHLVTLVRLGILALD